MSRIHRLLCDERGAITIDWVALGAGILLLGIAVVYAIFNTGVSSVVSDINRALGAIGIIDPGPAPNLSGVIAAVSLDLVLPDGTTVPEGSKVVDSKVEKNSDGTATNIVVLETPDGGKVTIVASASDGRPPPTDSTVTSTTTVTSKDGTTYDMSGYSGAAAGAA